MTANPVDLARIDHLLTLEEWNALPESEFRWELVEGVPVMVAAPLVRHQHLTVCALHDGAYVVVGEGADVVIDGTSLDLRTDQNSR